VRDSRMRPIVLVVHELTTSSEDNTPGGARNIPEDQLQTDTRLGLTEQEVLNRRRKYGEVCLQR
jgi:hypothetical protein